MELKKYISLATAGAVTLASGANAQPITSDDQSYVNEMEANLISQENLDFFEKYSLENCNLINKFKNNLNEPDCRYIHFIGEYFGSGAFGEEYDVTSPQEMFEGFRESVINNNQTKANKYLNYLSQMILDKTLGLYMGEKQGEVISSTNGDPLIAVEHYAEANNTVLYQPGDNLKEICNAMLKTQKEELSIEELKKLYLKLIQMLVSDYKVDIDKASVSTNTQDIAGIMDATCIGNVDLEEALIKVGEYQKNKTSIVKFTQQLDPSNKDLLLLAQNVDEDRILLEYFAEEEKNNPSPRTIEIFNNYINNLLKYIIMRDLRATMGNITEIAPNEYYTQDGKTHFGSSYSVSITRENGEVMNVIVPSHCMNEEDGKVQESMVGNLLSLYTTLENLDIENPIQYSRILYYLEAIERITEEPGYIQAAEFKLDFATTKTGDEVIIFESKTLGNLIIVPEKTSEKGRSIQ